MKLKRINETTTETEDGERIVRAVTPDGMGMVLWLPTDRKPWISTYPVAAQSSGSYFGPRKGKQFCLCLSYYGKEDNIDEMYDDFIALKEGTKKLTDLTHRFHNGQRDMYALGLCEEEGI